MTIEAELLDLRYACCTIGLEYQAKQLGHEVVVFLARAWIGVFGAVSTSLYVLFRTARAHLAPRGLRVLVTSVPDQYEARRSRRAARRGNLMMNEGACSHVRLECRIGRHLGTGASKLASRASSHLPLCFFRMLNV